jgi:hypothetical protein
MSVYRVIHTGPNTQFGGVNDGLFSVEYHVAMLGIVKTLPIIPANWQNRTAAMSVFQFVFMLFSSFS